MDHPVAPGRTKVGSGCCGGWRAKPPSPSRTTPKISSTIVGWSLYSSGRGPPLDMMSAPLFSTPGMWRALRDNSVKAHNYRSSTIFNRAVEWTMPCLFMHTVAMWSSFSRLENQEHFLELEEDYVSRLCDWPDTGIQAKTDKPSLQRRICSSPSG